MVDDIVVVGTGAFAEVVTEYFRRYAVGNVVAYACSPEFKTSERYAGLPLIDFDEMAVQFPPKSTKIFVAIGYRKMNSIREKVFKEISGFGYEFVTFVHPNVILWDSTNIGRNCFIFEDNTIQPFTEIGDNTILWSGNHIGHHSRVGSNVFISSHVVVSGSCTIGDNVFIGVNASFHDGVVVGDRSLIGAAAIVSRNVEQDSIISPLRTNVSEKKSFEVDF